uniref:ENTH domain-containing protein n=2 Tax=Lactuca sativa TaxID=4236 RepID=A0A9R1UVN5_LACSA|nr:hypothetical protein LSAT_V11C800416930 [Lactuca sativa]
MGTFESWRRAYGALKDSTTVGLAKVGSDFKDLDIAIIKATNHDECPPKDLHVKRIIVSTSSAAPRADVGYCIHTLSRRLMKTKNWIVAMKTLMVFHRILREGDPSFREELLIHSRRRHIFQIQDFRDDSSQLAWDCSSWLRTYATFLEERLECYRIVGFDIETERLTTAPGINKAYSRTRLMNIDELLEQLPAMQQLLYRLFSCQPEGAAYHNQLIPHALALVIKESLKIYCVINDGIIRLVELFFDLGKDEAIAAINIYKRSVKQTEQLGEFYNLGKHMRLSMNIQFPTLTQPPPSFLATMEEYVKGISSNGSDSDKKLEHDQDVAKETMEPVTQEIKEIENAEVLQDQEPELKHIRKVEEEVLPLIVIDDDDPPGLDEADPNKLEIEDNDASILALAIVQPSIPSDLTCSKTENTSSWELALVPSTSNYPNNTSPISHTKMGGGFDRLLLYSLYEDDMAKKQMQTGCNPGYQYGMQHESFQYHHPLPQQDQMKVVMQQQQYNINQVSYQQQYQEQYHQQCYQQRQHNNIFVPYNQQQSQPSNRSAQQSMPNQRPNHFGDGIDCPHGNRALI